MFRETTIERHPRGSGGRWDGNVKQAVRLPLQQESTHDYQ